MKSLTSQVNNLRLGHHVQPQFGIYQTSSCLRHVSLIGDQTRPAKATRATQSVHPFGPFWVQSAVGLFVFGLEDADDFAIGVFHEITTAASLIKLNYLLEKSQIINYQLSTCITSIQE